MRQIAKGKQCYLIWFSNIALIFLENPDNCEKNLDTPEIREDPGDPLKQEDPGDPLKQRFPIKQTLIAFLQTGTTASTMLLTCILIHPDKGRMPYNVLRGCLFLLPDCYIISSLLRLELRTGIKPITIKLN